jgi:hypothetical protein
LNAELLNRRETLLKYMVKGSKLQVVAEEMTKDISDPVEREKQIAVIRRDWGNRKHWMVNVVRLQDASFLAELIAGMNEAMKHCWIEGLREKNNASVRVAALRSIIMGESRVGLLLMKAGIIQVAPQQIESNVTIAGTPFDTDPKLREAILEDAERQRLEKERQNVKPNS